MVTNMEFSEKDHCAPSVLDRSMSVLCNDERRNRQ